MRRTPRGNTQLWQVVWLVICAVIGGLFADRHYVLGVAALAAVVWASMRWVRPATVTDKR